MREIWKIVLRHRGNGHLRCSGLIWRCLENAVYYEEQLCFYSGFNRYQRKTAHFYCELASYQLFVTAFKSRVFFPDFHQLYKKVILARPRTNANARSELPSNVATSLGNCRVASISQAESIFSGLFLLFNPFSCLPNYARRSVLAKKGCCAGCAGISLIHDVPRYC